MSIKPRKLSMFRSRALEQLETRDLLAGHGFGDFHHAAQGAAASALARFGSVAAAHANVQSLAHSAVFGALSSSAHTALVAQLSDSETGATGTIKYQVKTYDGETETELKVSISGATANSTLDVTIGDVIVGPITTDEAGAGTLILSSEPSDSEEPLPDNFPTSIVVGTAVSVGSLTGTLATPEIVGCHAANRTSLSAPLTDSVGTATGTVNYRTVTKGDTTTTTLTASVTGATANSTLDVTIGEVVVGQITTDDTGAGKLVLSSNPTGTQQPLPADFPTNIAAGTTVTVGSLSGTFAAISHGDSSNLFGHGSGRWGRYR